jgi:hypothetical protein
LILFEGLTFCPSLPSKAPLQVLSAHLGQLLIELVEITNLGDWNKKV